MSLQGSVRLLGRRAAEWDPLDDAGGGGQQLGSPRSLPAQSTRFLALYIIGSGALDPTPTRSVFMALSPQVRMAILCIIGQLALSGYQERIKGWGLKYVSVQLTLTTHKLTNRRENFSQRDLEERMVHKVTMDTVKIITSSVSGMTNEFWVRLLCYIMETDYMEALTPICISLTNLAEHQLHGQDVDVSVAGRAGKVLMSSPYKGEGHAIAMLNLLRTLSQSIAPSMADMWELEIPLLVRYLEEHTEFTWDQKAWEVKLIQGRTERTFHPKSQMPKRAAGSDTPPASPQSHNHSLDPPNIISTRSGIWSCGQGKRERASRSHSIPRDKARTGMKALGPSHQRLLPLQFLQNSLKKTRGSGWRLLLSKELNNQIVSFNSPSLQKVCLHRDRTWGRTGFLYRALGLTLATGLETSKVEVLLLELLYKTDYSNDFDCEGVILCFGLCAWGQVKTVLNVLHDFEERIQESEQSWQISAWRETVKSALMVMYSCVAFYCHPQMLLNLVDSPITSKTIYHYVSSCQDVCLKMAFMKSVVQVTEAINNIKNLEDFQFAQKTTLTSIIVAGGACGAANVHPTPSTHVIANALAPQSCLGCAGSGP
ncbi:Maestro heat-like repeat-containing protein member 2A [Saguinus oedipus]|uniref:Maestro heat-like repeat-containing protein member 2A n=1 Tax=Saguinus oedipus TaxID=9490 RepID=A0ABQ9VFV1_SAGOE|nr:Maestro heat-like repeat-containing protein member 2A [Saguinus oedipus]